MAHRSVTAAAGRPVIIRNNGCVLLDGDGEIISADRNIVISTQSTRRNATLICKAKHGQMQGRGELFHPPARQVLAASDL
jgi:hypothetical protein